MTTVELLDRRWRIEQCSARECGADIVFATNPGTGSRMPIDDPVAQVPLRHLHHAETVQEATMSGARP